MSEKCYFCGEGMVFKSVEVNLKWKNLWIRIEDVPCYECPRCGEQDFSVDTTRELDKICKQKAARYEKIPVYHFQSC